MPASVVRRSSPLPSSVSIGACPDSTPTSPSNAGATTDCAFPSKSTRSGEMTETLSIARASALQAFGVGDDVLNATAHEEGLLGIVVELPLHQPLEGADGVFQADELAGNVRELLGHMERLRHEALDASRARHHELVFLRELVHSQDRDDVLQLLVALQHALHLDRDGIVPLAEELRVHDARA